MVRTSIGTLSWLAQAPLARPLQRAFPRIQAAACFCWRPAAIGAPPTLRRRC